MTEARVPLDLPRRVMRRALAVAALTLLAAIALGLAHRCRHRRRGARDVAGRDHGAPRARRRLSDAQLVAVLAARDDETPLRHLSLSLRDGTGRLIVGRLPEPTNSIVVETLTDWHRRWRPAWPSSR